MARQADTLVTTLHLSDEKGGDLSLLEKPEKISKDEKMSNKIAEARSLALQFMSAHPCCIKAIPYENVTDPQSLTICLYVDTDGKGIPKDVKQAAKEFFFNYQIEFFDLQRRPPSKIITPLPSSEKQKEKELSDLSTTIEKNLYRFENRLNITAVRASYKVTDSIEQNIPCVTVFVLGKGRVPAGETNINKIKQLNDYPFDVVEGYYQPALGSSNMSYAFYLRGGVGIGVVGGSGAGTLGGFLEDEEGKCYILSNEHVLRPSEVKNNSNEIIIQQPPQFEYDKSLEEAEQKLMDCKYEKLNLVGKEPGLTQAEIDLKDDEYFNRAIAEAEYKLNKIKNEKPRQIAKYVCGLQRNVTLGDSNREIFVDAAIAELDEKELELMKKDKLFENETNRCSLYGFTNIEDFSLNCKTIDIENFAEEHSAQEPNLKFMKVGRESGVTFEARINLEAGDLFVKDFSLLYRVEVRYCNDCVGVDGEEGVHQNECIESRVCVRCGNELNNDEVSSFFLRNCLVVRQKTGKAFCKRGDLGSLLFGSDGRAWGLVFGLFHDRSRDMVFCLASPISATLKALEEKSGKKLKLWCMGNCGNPEHVAPEEHEGTEENEETEKIAENEETGENEESEETAKKEKTGEIEETEETAENEETGENEENEETEKTAENEETGETGKIEETEETAENEETGETEETEETAENKETGETEETEETAENEGTEETAENKETGETEEMEKTAENEKTGENEESEKTEKTAENEGTGKTSTSFERHDFSARHNSQRMARQADTLVTTLPPSDKRGGYLLRLEKNEKISKEKKMSNKIAEARSLALQFMSAHPCCIRAIPYENDSDPESLTICLYVDTDGKEIPEDVKQAANKLFANYDIEFDDLQRRPLSKIVTPLSSSKKQKKKELSNLSTKIEENLYIFKNRLNITAVRASYKVANSIELNIPCVTVFVLGKGRVPAGETNINKIKQLNNYPFDVVEGYYQLTNGPSNMSYAFYLRGGVGIGVVGGFGAGTLGGFLEDEKGKCYILSNEHVLHPLQDKNNMNETIIQQPAQMDHDKSLEKTKQDLKDCKDKKLNLDRLIQKEDNQEKIPRHRRMMKKLDSAITEKQDILTKMENNEKPRQIAKYVCGLHENVPLGDNGKIFVDAAIAELYEEELELMKMDKLSENEANRCPLYGFTNIKDFSLNCKTIDIENLAKEHSAQQNLTFMKVGRESGVTSEARIDLDAEGVFLKDFSSLYRVQVKYCNNCVGVDDDGGSIHQNQFIQSRVCVSCGNKLNDDEVSSSWLRNCLVVRQNRGKIFCEKGDSGSLLFGNDGRAWGLVFGTFHDLSRGYDFCLASSISATLKALKEKSGKNLKLWCMGNCGNAEHEETEESEETEETGENEVTGETEETEETGENEETGETGETEKTAENEETKENEESEETEETGENKETEETKKTEETGKNEETGETEETKETAENEETRENEETEETGENEERRENEETEETGENKETRETEETDETAENEETRENEETEETGENEETGETEETEETAENEKTEKNEESEKTEEK